MSKKGFFVLKIVYLAPHSLSCFFVNSNQSLSEIIPLDVQ